MRPTGRVLPEVGGSLAPVQTLGVAEGALNRARPAARRQYVASRLRQLAGISTPSGRRSVPHVALRFSATPLPDVHTFFKPDAAPVNAKTDDTSRNSEVWRADADKYLPSMICPIGFDPFRDPVQAADGHTYERASIARWLATKRTSPKTGLPMAPDLAPNHGMRAAVEEFTEKLKQSQSFVYPDRGLTRL